MTECCICTTTIVPLGDDPVSITVAARSDAGARQELWAHATCLHRVFHASVPLLPELPAPLSVLPRSLAVQSASPTEIVLGYDGVLEAIRIIDAAGWRILGWEGWIRTRNGRVGHGDAPVGTADLSSLSPPEASRMTRATMADAVAVWQGSAAYPEAELLFCITVVAPHD
jgi:hypothetical protein